jgi:hypothetical protein
MRLNQKHLIETAMQRFGVTDSCRKFMTPMAVDAKVSIGDCPATPNKNDTLFMQKLLGTLQYISLTRPDIKLAVNSLARVASNPSKDHLDMALRVVKYLAHTRDLPLTFSRGEWRTPDNVLVPSGQIITYVDASYADSGPAERMRSRSGHLHMRAGAAFQAKSRLQSVTAGSSCQAEVVALYTAGTDVQGALQNLIRLEMPHVGPVIVMEDNSACMSVMSVTSKSSHSNSRHYLVKYFYVADLCEDGTLRLRKVDTKHQLSDGLTKPLDRATFERHRFFIMGHHALNDEELKKLRLERHEPASA